MVDVLSNEMLSAIGSTWFRAGSTKGYWRGEPALAKETKWHKNHRTRNNTTRNNTTRNDSTRNNTTRNRIIASVASVPTHILF